MDRILMLIIGVLTLTINITAQYNIKSSEPIGSYRLPLEEIIGQNDHHVFTRKSGRNQHVIEKLDTNFNVVAKLSIDAKKGNLTLAHESMALLDQSIVLFWEELNRRTNDRIIWTQYVSTDSLKMGETTKLDSMLSYSNESDDPNSKDLPNSFEYFVSEGKKYLLFAKNQCSSGKLQFRFMNSKLQTLWTSNVELAQFKPMLENVICTDDGNIYFWTKPLSIYFEPNFVKPPSYSLFHISQNGAKIKELSFSMKKKAIGSMILYPDNGGIKCFGTYYTRQDKNTIRGLFAADIPLNTSPNKKKSKLKFQSFDEGFITSGWSKKQIARAYQKKTSKNELIGLSNRHIVKDILEYNNKLALILEYNHEYTSTSYDHTLGFNTLTHHFVSNDIIIANYSAKLLADTIIKIPKKQYSTNDDGTWSSHVSYVSPKGLMFFFNDNSKNLDSTASSEKVHVANGSKVASSVTTVFNNGSVKKDYFYTEKGKSFSLSPTLWTKTADGKLIVSTSLGRGQKKLHIISPH